MAGLLQCTFDGRAFVPSTAYQARLARERFGEGEIVLLNVENERSWKSHARCFTPHSQSVRAMGSKEFYRSKEAILRWIEALVAERAA